MDKYCNSYVDYLNVDTHFLVLHVNGNIFYLFVTKKRINSLQSKKPSCILLKVAQQEYLLNNQNPHLTLSAKRC